MRTSSILHVLSLGLLPYQRCLALSASSFALGASSFKNGDLGAARRHFENHLDAFPEDEPTINVLAKLDELGVVATSASEEPTSSNEQYREERIAIGKSDRVVLALTPTSGAAAAAGEAAAAAADSSGTQVWTSACALLDWLSADECQQADALIQGKRVLELGSGTGVLALGLAQLGASHVCLTDLPQNVPLLKANVAANAASTVAAGCTVQVEALAWGQTSGSPLFSGGEDEGYDLIVASDVTYDDALMEPLASSLSALLRTRGKPTALLALTDVRGVLDPWPCYESLFRELKVIGQQKAPETRVVVERKAAIAAADTVASHEGSGGAEGVQFADEKRGHTIGIFAVRNEED